MNTAEASAPGKLILVGEHAVVYGHPALAVAVDRTTTVRLRPRSGPTGLDRPPIDDARVDAALVAILPREGVGVEIESDLPIGRGMGSSAALAVALARAWANMQGIPHSTRRIGHDAMRVERIFHGNPSGIDHTVSMTGGALFFQRRDNDPVYRSLACPDLPLVVIDSGTAGDTAALVAGVRDRRPGCDSALQQIGALAQRFTDQIPTGDAHTLGPMLTENHALLVDIGVSTSKLDHIVELALSAGATGAKLSGAGGGGVVVALATDHEPVIQAATAAGYTSFSVKIAPPL